MSMTDDERWLLEEKYDGEKTLGFFTDKERLQAGEPLAYVIGYIPFLHTQIYLDSRPLIPRPETEFWVEKAIAEIRASQNAAPKILDLCAGSGCIGVAVAKALPEAVVHFAEIDPAHHPTIEKNLHVNSIDLARTKIFSGDLFTNTLPPYDYILSNPPYISSVIDRAEQSVKKFEPHLALYGGTDGLDIIRTLLDEASAKLTPFGKLFIEHEPEQVQALQEIAQKIGFSITTHNDQYNMPRYSSFAVAQ